MDMSELVMSIVFENEEAFKDISKKQIGIICKTTKLATESITIMQMRNKYMAFDMYNSVSNKLNEALYTLYNGGCPETVAKYEALCSEAHDIMADIYDFCSYNPDVKDCLQMLIMAEYKEATYNIVYSYRDNKYRHFHTMLSQVFIENLHTSVCDDVYNHFHEPHHYVFDGKKYMFYDKVEINGNSILEIYDDIFFNSDSEDEDEE
jgi:hypothetical protein